MCVPCRESSHEGLTAKGEKLFHRLHAGRMGSLKCFFMRRLAQSPDPFPYLMNCLHNPPLGLEVSWRCWCCKGSCEGPVQKQAAPHGPWIFLSFKLERDKLQFCCSWEPVPWVICCSSVPRGYKSVVLSPVETPCSPAPRPSSSSAPALTSPY